MTRGGEDRKLVLLPEPKHLVTARSPCYTVALFCVVSQIVDLKAQRVQAWLWSADQKLPSQN